MSGWREGAILFGGTVLAALIAAFAGVFLPGWQEALRWPLAFLALGSYCAGCMWLAGRP